MRALLIISVGTLLLKFTAPEDRVTTSTPMDSTVSLKKQMKDAMSTTHPWDTGINEKNELNFNANPQHEGELKETVVFNQYKSQSSVTRLAKTLSSGLIPYFQKEYFEPFEKRSRPVTLVGLRRHGLFPRNLIAAEQLASEDTAELQSPFNDISNFWMDNIGY